MVFPKCYVFFAENLAVRGLSIYVYCITLVNFVTFSKRFDFNLNNFQTANKSCSMGAVCFVWTEYFAHKI